MDVNLTKHLAFVMLLLVSILLTTTIFAAGETVEVTATVSDSSILVGDQITVSFVCSEIDGTGNPIEAAFSCYMDHTYDPNVLRLDAVNYNSTYGEFNGRETIDQSAGTITAAGALAGISPPPTGSTVYELVFTAISTGSTSITTQAVADTDPFSEITAYGLDTDERANTLFPSVSVTVGVPIASAENDTILISNDTTFTWDAVNGAGGYSLLVKDPDGFWVGTRQWVPASNCTGDTCSYSYNVYRGAGEYTIELITKYGDTFLPVTTNTATSSTYPIPMAMNDAIATNGETTFTWENIPNAGGYSLLVKDPNGFWVGTRQWVPVGNCMGDTCSYNYDVYRELGEYTLELITQFNGAFQAPVTNTATAAAPTPEAENDLIRLNGDTTFIWDVVPDASGYSLLVKDPDGFWVGTRQWVPQSSCTGDTCTYSYDVYRRSGEYTLELITQYNGSFLSPQTNTATAPVNPIPVANNNTIVPSGNTTFTWDNVSDANGYSLLVKDPDGFWVGTRQWVPASSCMGNTCSYSYDVYRGLGEYTLDLITQRNGTFQPSATNTALAEAPTPSAVDDTIRLVGDTTFVWDAVPDASGYSLLVKDPSATWVGTRQWVSQSSCTSDTCTYSYNVYRNAGKYRIELITAYNGTFLDPKINSAVAPELPTASAVNDTIQSSGDTTFTWNNISGAEGYSLLVKDPNGLWVGTRQWVPAGDCSSSCSYSYDVYQGDGVYSIELITKYGGTFLSATLNTASTSTGGAMLASGQDVDTEIVVDDGDSTSVDSVGDWLLKTDAEDAHNGSYQITENMTSNDKSFTFNATIPTAGAYEVSARWGAEAYHSALVPMVVMENGIEVATKYVNQQTNGGEWISLGTYEFSAGSEVSVELQTLSSPDAEGTIVADAVRFSLVQP